MALPFVDEQAPGQAQAVLSLHSANGSGLSNGDLLMCFSVGSFVTLN